ncbi:MAG: hypothetical protein FWE82_06420 [Defluviitaleaceae bacterium]|nr:hypothetical protein [Defluviitaleaceae bacterium]
MSRKRNARENLLSLLRRDGFDYVPVSFGLCPSLMDEYRRRGHTGDPGVFFMFPWRSAGQINVKYDPDAYRKWHGSLKDGTWIDAWGVAHEPGSKEAMHMTRMRHPLSGIEDLEKIKAYPLPDFAGGTSDSAEAIKKIHAEGLAGVGHMECTIWETAWYMRGMEDLMVDMLTGSPVAEYILDAVTERAVLRGETYAKAGVDIVYLGDDIGMQSTPLFSTDLYRKWIKPRLKRVIDAVRNVRRDTVVCYHTCGHATPFINDLIEAGVDVLNPLQPESMDAFAVINEYRGRISFHGAVGTQRLMPFGTPDEIRRTVTELLDATGPNGGMFPAPTHLLEPEVPWENILAYVEACKDYKK